MRNLEGAPPERQRSWTKPSKTGRPLTNLTPRTTSADAERAEELPKKADRAAKPHRRTAPRSSALVGVARVGCSGWVYKHWRGPVYPETLPTRRWFDFYSGLFNTVEINNSFYRLPAPATVQTWAAQAPPNFVYSLKMGSFGSHRMKLADSGRWLASHVDCVGRLGAAKGPTLVQRPPHWGKNLGRLEDFLSAAPADKRWAIEFREPSWLSEDTYEVLRRHRAALCLHDLLPDIPWELTTDWTYVRFHGPDAVTQPYGGGYSSKAIKSYSSRLSKWLAQGIDVYAYFNNDDSGHAVADARRLARELPQ